MDISTLVEKYRANRANFISSTYNETQLRNDFIDPLLKCFGWDVDNEKGETFFFRDVIQEEAIEVEDSTSKKKPDYTLRINGTRKLFFEVKKPSINVLNSEKAAFQTRRYGWNANLGISILTNFENLVIYDCRLKPNPNDNEHVARVKVFNYDKYITDFEEIESLISYNSVNSGILDDTYSVYQRKGETFDDYFLSQIEDWRKKLAISAITNNSNIDGQNINLLIQRLLNRIIFLRICEDRTIEKYETLKKIKNYSELKNLFTQSDKRYNSGLFDFIEDTLSQDIEVDSTTLLEIFNELYFPLSPYDFSVVDPAILSQIYEKFLGSYLSINSERELFLVEEPEVSLSNGVVPTPKLIVEQIVRDTLSPLVEDKTCDELSKIKVADICCGSGTFLISAFDFLLQKQLELLSDDKVQDSQNSPLGRTLKVKKDIIVNNLFGVDINPYATEVTEFSLLLKLLENENDATVNEYLSSSSEKLLPNLKENIKCGNSLVDSIFFKFLPEAIEDDDILYQVNPFDWVEEFPFLKSSNGFDAIIGNPPYVRIQKLVKYAPEEIKFYQSDISGYTVAKKDTIDKYYVFIQRAINLLNKKGYLGYIIPHKFFLLKGGKELREFIIKNTQISKISHFGITQVFPEKSTYTAILILKKEKEEELKFRRINNISSKTLSQQNNYTSYKSENYNSSPWIFLTPETEKIFNKIKNGNTVPLNKLSNICVGLQTSADKIYIFQPELETNTTFKFTKEGKTWEIEKEICRPALYDLSFNLFDTISENAQIIFPYNIEDGTAKLFTEEIFASNYPLTWKYLNNYKTKLQKRNLQGTNPKWYEFGRSQSLAKFHNTPKIIWSVLSTQPPYTIDLNNLQFTGGGNGPYYALISNSKYSLYYLIAILCHPIIENMVYSGASEFRGSYYSHGKQFINEIPIPIINQNNTEEKKIYDQIIRIVKNLINSKNTLNQNSYGMKRNIQERKISTLQDQLISIINDLYGLTEAEFNTVMNDEMFREKTVEEE